MKKVEVRQEDITVDGHSFTVTHIPTATSGSWFTVHDACEIWGAVAIDDLSGQVLGWRNPPKEEHREKIEQAIKQAFGIPASRKEFSYANRS